MKRGSAVEMIGRMGGWKRERACVCGVLGVVMEYRDEEEELR
jgi:hypothetical protein